MPRSIDWLCEKCGTREWSIAGVDDTRTCTCGAAMTQDWLPRVKRDAQWGDAQAIMVHVNDKTGEIRYVGSHEAKLKDGYHREYLRSLPEINRFEKAHKVANHVMHFDRNGRGLDDTYRGERYTH